ncbi:MAG: tRNA pseudouridine(55) synthase TruB [Phycisphaeraceae bacterium]|nr:tRNA pseudouridine(55) synthase TruB [Phycisphaeraceae bacterium]
MTCESTCQGLLIVDKPVGCSSMDVVRHVRRAARLACGRKVRTGHAGSLDPLASGVLLCCLGPATKRIGQLMDLTKIYVAEVDLSAFTATDDREGERQQVTIAQPPDEQQVRQALKRFLGDIEQRPPAFSAVHINGKRAYKLARKGEVVEPAARMVRVDAIELISYQFPLLALRITCGKGTYIRSLARDIGKALGTGGHLASLRRTAIGSYTVQQALPLDHFQKPLQMSDLIELT